jgi:SAM-dependent methyltransferase
MADAPFQPATNLWRCVELPMLASALPKQGRGLDVGCGDGVLTALLGRLCGADWDLVGIDLSPEETALARSAGFYRAVHTASGSRVPEADASFDFAFANSVLEHITDLPATLRETARCLKPGGLFAATVPSWQFHRCLTGPSFTQSRRGYFAEIDARLAHVHYWSEQRWRDELSDAGMELESAAGYLAQRQVQRWETWSNWTGGLLYRLSGRRRQPIDVQRRMGLRRGLPVGLRFLAAPLATLVGTGVCGTGARESAPFGCVLVVARRKGA